MDRLNLHGVDPSELHRIGEDLREIRAALKPNCTTTCTAPPQPTACLAEPKTRSWLSEIAIGLATAAVLGVSAIVFYLIFRKKDSSFGLSLPANQPQTYTLEPVQLALLPPPPEPVYAPPPVTMAPTPPAPSAAEAPPIVTEWHRVRTVEDSKQAGLRSFTLPPLGTRDEAVRVATAGTEPMTVVVRTVSPMGSYAVLSFTAAELNTPGAGTTPTGDTLFVVVGDKQKVRIAPRQALFAKGSTAGVVVSVVSDA